jgi:transcriptional regulator with XRE-family HTH domain
MKYAEKLYKQMLQKGLNQQKLAKTSRVSDSEVSRILGGKSQPGLDNAFRLARAVGVSLDFLADDSLESDPMQSPATARSTAEHEVLAVAREFGLPGAQRLLEIARVLGYETAIRRLVGADTKPVTESVDGTTLAPDTLPLSVTGPSRSNSA